MAGSLPKLEKEKKKFLKKYLKSLEMVISVYIKWRLLVKKIYGTWQDQGHSVVFESAPPPFPIPAQWDSPPLQTGNQEHRAPWSCSTQRGERLALLILLSTTCCWHWFLDKCGQKVRAPLFLLTPLMRQRLYPEPCTSENTGALNTLASTSRVGLPERRGKSKRL